MEQDIFNIKAYEYTARGYINFLIETKQWDLLCLDDINSWLDNFGDTLGCYYGLKLLVNCNYYSEKQIIVLLKKGLQNRIVYEELIGKIDIEKALNFPVTYFNAKAYEYLQRTIFLPLLHSDQPSESANWILRTLVNEQIIQKENHCYPNHIEKIKEYENIIIVDDCIGTGKHIKDFIKSQVFLELESLGKKIIFFTVVGAEEGVNRLLNQNIQIRCVEYIDENRRIFGNHCNVWKDAQERISAMNYFKLIEKNRGVPMLGYKRLDYSFIMYNNIPNWSLPVFWKETPDWQPLKRRKSS